MLRRDFGIGLALLALLLARPGAADETADEQKAIEAIRKAGGTVQVDEADPAKPAVRVDLDGAKATDADLAPIARLTRLRKLYLTGTPITDAGLVPLEDLARLEVLDLAGTKITDAGLAHLEDLPKLRLLDLSHTNVTAAGLEHLKKLDGLKELYLIGLKPKPEEDKDGKKGSEFEQKVLDFLKAQPQVKVVR